MQGRDEYEFDYYGGAPFWMKDESERMQPGTAQRRAGWAEMTPGRTMRPEKVPARESCCQSRINEILEEMARFETMQSDENRRIMAEIRRVCGSIDGRGCTVLEGEPNREMIEMLLEQVMERLDRMPDGEMFFGEREAAARMGDDRDWRKNLVEALLWQELLRRRMRRRMHRRPERY